jgi:aspartate/methionine/tyrosine aminotransferase
VLKGGSQVHIDQATTEDLQALLTELQAEYKKLGQQGLELDLTRGKPSTEQVCLSDSMDGILAGNFCDSDGVDVRNYGHPTGLREARELFAQILGTNAEQVLVGGNSSLSLMYQVVEFALNFGFQGQGWKSQGQTRFLCPVPGYDRHFALCDHLGIDMVTVPMTDTGPDMDQVEALVSADSSIKGIWCVPRFSNPTGVVYSPETVMRMAELPRRAAADFLVLWDNAYAVHSFADDAPQLASITPYCKQHGSADNVIQFGSTSKMTYAGAGVAFLAASANNLAALSRHLGYASIGPDKVNQLRHVHLLRNMATLQAHMAKHAEIIAPRFALVERYLQEGFSGTGMGQWTSPRGGYFVTFESGPGLATSIVTLAADIGVKLTPAGATWPHGKDPQDNIIRLAPTYPTLPELESTLQAFVLCVKLATLAQKLEQNVG